MPLSGQDIVAGLRALGVKPGMVLMVHSALSTLGEVEGGADTVIDALLEALGPEGTLLMPAMGGMPVFDVTEAKSHVGIITDVFWRRPDVIRSIHPTHSAAAIGPLAEKLLEGHISQPTALGPASPWGRLTRLENGYILLLGCDQDRNTLLHGAEEAVEAPYLSTITRDYLDENRVPRTATLEKFPGPHRDFIGLDHVFSQRGVMHTGKIGSAVCRLMHAEETFEVAVEELQANPAAVLCDNPNCDDCVMQRGKIKRARLAEEDFTLCARLDDAARNIAEIVPALAFLHRLGLRDIELGEDVAAMLDSLCGEGCEGVIKSLRNSGLRVRTVSTTVLTWENLVGVPTGCATFVRALDMAQKLGADFVRLPATRDRENMAAAEAAEGLGRFARFAGDRGAKLLIENAPNAPWDTKSHCEQVFAECGADNVYLGFNPAEFAHVGEHPFLKSYYRGELKKHVAALYICDGCLPPREPYTLPGRGKGEVKELMSILRCKSFAGMFCLKPGRRGEYPWAILQEQWDAFWHLMDTL